MMALVTKAKTKLMTTFKQNKNNTAVRINLLNYRGRKDVEIGAYFAFLLLVSCGYNTNINEIGSLLSHILNSDGFRIGFQLVSGLIFVPYYLYFHFLKPTAIGRTRAMPTDRFISTRDLRVVGQRGR